MLERVRATVCIWQYETKGRICAIRGTIVVVSIFMENLWSLVLKLKLYVIFLAYQNQGSRHGHFLLVLIFRIIYADVHF